MRYADRPNRHYGNEHIDRKPFKRFDNHIVHILGLGRKNISYLTDTQSESYRNGEIGFATVRIRLRNKSGGIRSLASEQPPSRRYDRKMQKMHARIIRSELSEVRFPA